MGASSPGYRVALAETARLHPASGELVTANIRLKLPIGEGGMGRVWLAEHLSLKTDVVVKFMSEDLAEDADAALRFSREAAAAAQVKSPHVVQMLDYGVTENGVPFIVMEYLEGEDLSHRLEREPLAPHEAGDVVLQLGRALGKAHERGIVHRDVKPSNVFLCDAGDGRIFVKLLDFGIAKSNAGRLLAGKTTDTGALMGSPFYMSPEQVIGSKELDFRTDLWALGVLGFELATGRRPFDADTVGALALKIHHDTLPSPSDTNTSLPRAVDEWFFKACARDPNARFESAREQAESFAAALLGADAPRISGSLPPVLGKSMLDTDATLALKTKPPEAKGRKLLATFAVILATLAVALIGMSRVRVSDGPAVPQVMSVPLPAPQPPVALEPRTKTDPQVPPLPGSSAVNKPLPRPSFSPPVVLPVRSVQPPKPKPSSSNDIW